MTADCLPILICNQSGNEIAAIHAGWRGLLAGIIDNTIAKMSAPRDEIIAWLGPAIGPQAFEINNTIKKSFEQRTTAWSSAFYYHEEKIFADIYQLARVNLESLDINQVFGGEFCTFDDDKSFFSHRRGPKPTGRMASIVWINNN